MREYPPLESRAGQSLAADCFCGQSDEPDSVRRQDVQDMERMTGLNLDSGSYCFDEAVMAFIEQAVAEAMVGKAVR